MQFSQSHFLPFQTPLKNPYQSFNVSLFIPKPFQQTIAYQFMLNQVRNFEIMQMPKIFLPNLPNNMSSTDQSVSNYNAQTNKFMPWKLESSLSTSSEENLQNILPQSQTLIPKSTYQQTDQSQHLKMELDRIVTFLLKNMGKNEQIQIDNMRKLYLHNQTLLQIYDKLVMKYFSAKKCREDIVRYILRKAFKKIRGSIIQKEKINNKKATIVLCKKYFQKSFEKIQKSGVDVQNEEQLIDLFMPYKKKSQNRTMNTNFVLEIFSSEEFCKEYQQFLGEFESLVARDNNQKKEKLLDFLVECVKKNSVSKIGTYNKLPWLDVWVDDTNNIAFDLVGNQKAFSDRKKSKQE